MLLPLSWNDPLNTSCRISDCLYHTLISCWAVFFQWLISWYRQGHTHSILYHLNAITHIGWRPLLKEPPTIPLKKIFPSPSPRAAYIKKKFFSTATLTLPPRNRHSVFHISWTIFGTAPAPFGIRTSSSNWLTVEIFTLAHFLWGTFPREGSLCSSQPDSTVLTKKSSSLQAGARTWFQYPHSEFGSCSCYFRPQQLKTSQRESQQEVQILYVEPWQQCGLSPAAAISCRCSTSYGAGRAFWGRWACNE